MDAATNAARVVADGAQHLVEALVDDVLGAVDQVDDGVGIGLDALDGLRVDREMLAVAAGHSDHGAVLPLRGAADPDGAGQGVLPIG
jgi:hypothetical protein